MVPGPVTMSESGVVVRRKVAAKQENGGASSSKNENRDKDANARDSDAEDADSKETRLTLMEEVLLMGLKDKEVSKAPDMIHQ